MINDSFILISNFNHLSAFGFHLVNINKDKVTATNNFMEINNIISFDTMAKCILCNNKKEEIIIGIVFDIAKYQN